MEWWTFIVEVRFDFHAWVRFTKDVNNWYFKPVSSFVSGKTYLYSTYGWTLLSAVIEKASDSDFLTYMKNKVFLPLGMSSTCVEKHEPLLRHRSRWVRGACSHRIKPSSHSWSPDSSPTLKVFLCRGVAPWICVTPPTKDYWDVCWNHNFVTSLNLLIVLAISLYNIFLPCEVFSIKP